MYRMTNDNIDDVVVTLQPLSEHQAKPAHMYNLTDIVPKGQEARTHSKHLGPRIT